MITKQNLKEVIQTISTDNISKAILGDSDYILLQLHVYNVGGFGTIENVEYSEEAEQHANEKGNLFVSKDDFLQLCDELEIFEY